jgi:hypothetical protein
MPCFLTWPDVCLRFDQELAVETILRPFKQVHILKQISPRFSHLRQGISVSSQRIFNQNTVCPLSFARKSFLRRNIVLYFSERRVSPASHGPQCKTRVVCVEFLYDRIALENLISLSVSWFPKSNTVVLLNTFRIFICLCSGWIVKTRKLLELT